jgi:hypothetical protein
MGLGWSSLTFTPDAEAVRELRSSWAWLLKDEYIPVLFSVLGDVFFKDLPNGEVKWLNTGTGEVRCIAPSVEQFREMLGTEKAAEWFMPGLVEQLHAAGKIPATGECYTYVTLPVFAEGKYEIANLNAVPAKEHFAVTAHVLREIQGLPEGAKVKLHVAE